MPYSYIFPIVGKDVMVKTINLEYFNITIIFFKSTIGIVAE